MKIKNLSKICAFTLVALLIFLVIIFVSTDLVFSYNDLNLQNIWTKTFGGTSTDEGNAIIMGSDGSVYVTGSFRSTVDFDPSNDVDEHISNGSYDVFITKYESDGTYEWTKTFGGSGSDKGYSVTFSNGSIYIIGTFSNTVDFDPSSGVDNHTSNGSYDVFVSKYQSDGTYEWTKTFGGSNADKGYSITASDNVLYAVGTFSNTVDFDPTTTTDNHVSNGYYDVFITKYQADGTYVWTRTFGGTSLDYGSSIKVKGNYFYVVGSFNNTVDFDPSDSVDSYTSNGLVDAYIVKYQSDGSYQWAKPFGGVGYDYANELVISSDDALYITGVFQNTVDFDTSTCVDNHTSNGSYDSYVIKYNSDEIYSWARTFGGAGTDHYSNICVYNDNIYLTGEFSSSFDFDPTEDEDIHATNGTSDIYITKYKTNGEYKWTKTFNGSIYGDEKSNAIIAGTNGSIYLIGSFEDTVDFDSTFKVNNKSSNGNVDSFISKYTEEPSPYVTINRFPQDTTRDNTPEIIIQVDSSVPLSNVSYNLENLNNADDCTFLRQIESNQSLYSCNIDSELDDNRYYTINIFALDNNNNGSDLTDYKFLVDHTSEKDLYYVDTTLIETGSSTTAEANAIDNDALYTIGIFTDTVDFDPTSGVDEHTSNGNKDVYVYKVKHDGTYEWTRTFGGTGNDYGKSIAISADAVYMTGYFMGTVDFDPTDETDEYTSVGSNDVYVTKYKKDGTYEWTKVFGGIGSDAGYSISLQADNVYITGNFSDTVDFDPTSNVDNNTSIGGTDIFVARYSSDGTYEWVKTFGGTNSDTGVSIATDDNYIFLTGNYYDTVDFDPSDDVDNHTSNGDSDVFVSSYALNGIYKWTRTFGGTEYDATQYIYVDSGDIYITGSFANTVDFDPSGDVDNHTSNGDLDIFITKYNSGGTYKWAKTFGSSEYNDYGYSIASAMDGIYVSGTVNNSDQVDFDPSNDEDIYNISGIDVFISKYDTDGGYEWSKVFGDFGDVSGGHIVSTNNLVYTSGHVNYGRVVDFDPSDDTDYYQAESSQASFISKYTYDELPTEIFLENIELNPPYRQQTSFTLTGNLTENLGIIFDLQYQLDNSGIWTSCQADDGEFDEKNESFTCAITGLDDGTHSIKLRSVDSNNNYTGAGDYAITNYKVDTTKPSNDVDNTDYEITKISGNHIQDDDKKRDDYRRIESLKNKPTIKFETIADVVSGIKKYEIRITKTNKVGRKKDNDYTYIGDIPANSPNDGKDRERDGVVIKYDGDYITVEPKDNKYKLDSGRSYYIKVRAYDEANNFVDSKEVKVNVLNEEEKGKVDVKNTNFELTKISKISYTPSIDSYYYTSSNIVFKGITNQTGNISVYVDGQKSYDSVSQNNKFEIRTNLSHGEHNIEIRSGDRVESFKLTIGVENFPQYILQMYNLQ